MPAGACVADMLRAAGVTGHAHVWIDDEYIPQGQWETIPRPGSRLTVRAVPMGGDGEGKNTGRIILSIAVMALSAYAGGVIGGTSGNFAGALATAGLGTVGGLLVNALIPPPSLKDKNDGLALDRAQAITGSRNQALPYGTIPRVLGKHRLFPPYGARPFTENMGTKQYYRMLFVPGYGPLEISDLRIGETSLLGEGESLVIGSPAIASGSFAGVEYEIQPGYANDPPLSLFGNQVYEESLSVELKEPGIDASTSLYMEQGSGSWDTGYVYTAAPGGWNTRTTQSEAQEISLEFSAPIGLFFFGKTGGRYRVEVLLELQYCQAGTGAWGPLPVGTELDGDGETGNVGPAAEVPPLDNSNSTLVKLSGSDGVTKRLGVRFPVSKGQYDVRVRRVRTRVWRKLGGSANEIDFDIPLSNLGATVTWPALRTVYLEDPIRLPTGLCKIALRIQATDQLNGILDQFNCVAQALLPTYDGSAWTAPVATSNPAWAYAEVFCGGANKRARPYSRLRAAELKAWADECDSSGLEFNAVIDGRTTVFELARDVAACGLAAYARVDGGYTVIQDTEQSVPVQHFTPRNSWGFKGTKVFREQVHALKVRFLNRDKGWQQDELYVYADGYSSANATKFETLPLFGVTSADQAWKTGRYHLAVAQLRPETYELWADIEHIVCTRGSLVRAQHDVPLWGSSVGARVKSVLTDGGIVGVVLDEIVAMEAGKSYACRFRTSAGESVLASVVNTVGETNTLSFVAPVAGIAAGDLAMFGEATKETVELKVKAIYPGRNLTARLVLVDAAPAVHSAWTGPIPPFDSQITNPIRREDLPPGAPVILAIATDDSVLTSNPDGSYTARVVVSFASSAGSTIAPQTVQAQYRRHDTSDTWTSLPDTPASSGRVIIDGLEVGADYETRLRFLSAYGKASLWTVSDPYTVAGKNLPPGNVGDVVADPTPLGVTLRFDYPSWLGANGYLEIYGAQTDDFLAATLLGITRTGEYFHSGAAPGETWYYWTRAVDGSGNPAETYYPDAAEGGVSGAPVGVDTLHLAPSLFSRIALIDEPGTGLVTKVDDLETVYGDTVSAAQSAAEAATSASDAATSASQAATSASNAGNSATAAASSASAAASSATDAGQSAAAAQTSATTATTKAGEASTSASQAATSATDAAGSASTAATSASQAATSATNASNSATAASNSASVATTKAGEASTSASAASAAQVAAESARDNAAGSASAASTSASQASTSASNAASSATAASGHANTATTKAAEASTSATSAATSATNADGSATAAANMVAVLRAAGGSDNIIPDGEFSNSVSDVSKYWSAGAIDTGGYEGSPCLKLTASGSIIDSVARLDGTAAYVPCAKGDVFYVSYRYFASEDFDGTANSLGVGSNAYDASKLDLSNWPTLFPSSLVKGSWQEVTGTITAAADDQAFIAFRCTVRNSASTGYVLFDNVRVSRNPQRFVALEQAAQITDLEGQYTVKIDNNGFLAGFGLASTPVDGVPLSEFVAMVDRFAVIDPASGVLTVSSLTSSGGTATVTTSAAHGLSVDDYVVITGAAQADYNGTQKVTAVGSATQFSYAISGSPVTPATVQDGFPGLRCGRATVPFIIEDGIVRINTALHVDKLIGDTITGKTLQTAASGTRFIVSAADGEAHFYGDRGDGTIVELATIGISNDGSDQFVGVFGTYGVGTSVIGVLGRSYDTKGVMGGSAYGDGVYGNSGFGRGVVGTSSADVGVSGDGKYGGEFSVSGGTPIAPIRLIPNASGAWPTHTAALGSLYTSSSGDLYMYFPTGWERLSGWRTASLGASGYQTLPNGVILQWGTLSGNTGLWQQVNFPLAFPSACWAITTSMKYTGTTDSASTSNITIRQEAGYEKQRFRAVISGGNTSWAGDWIAIGA